MSVEGPLIPSAHPAQNPPVDPDKLKQENMLALERLKSELDRLEAEIRKIENEQKALNEKKKTGAAPDEYEAEQAALDERRIKAEERRDEVEKSAQALIRQMNLVGFFTAKDGEKEAAQKKEEGNKEADQKKQAANAKAKSKETTPTPKKEKGEEEKDEKKKGRMAQWWDKVGHIYTSGDNDEAGNEMALIMMRLLALLALLFKLGKMAGNKAKEAIEEKLGDKKGELERESEKQDLFKQNEDLDQQQALQDAKMDLFQQVQDDSLGDNELEELFAMSKGAPPTYKEAIEDDEGVGLDEEIEDDPLIYEEEVLPPPVYQQSTVSDVEHPVRQYATTDIEQPDLPDDDSDFGDDDQIIDDDEEMEIDGEKIEGEIMGHAVPPLTQASQAEPLQVESTLLPEASSAKRDFIEQDEEERNKNKENLMNAARGVIGAVGNLVDEMNPRKESASQTEDPPSSPSNAEDELASLEKDLFSAELPEEDNSQKEKLLAATKDVADKTADLLKGVNDRSTEASITEPTTEPAFPEEEKVITQLKQSPDWPQEGRVKELIAKHEGFIAEAGRDLNSEEVRAKEAAKAAEMGTDASVTPTSVETSPEEPQVGGVKALIAKHEGFIKEAGKDLNSEEVRAKEAAKAAEMGTDASVTPTSVETSPEEPQVGGVKALIAKHEGFIEEAGKDLNSEEVRAKEAAKAADLEGSKPSQEKQADEQEEPIKAELGVETPKPTLSPEEELASLEKNLFSAQLPEEDNSQKENLLAATRQVADATVNLLKQVPDRPEASSEKNIEQKVEPQSQSQTEPEAAPSPSSTPKRKGGRVAELIAKHEGFIKEAGKDLNSEEVRAKEAAKAADLEGSKPSQEKQADEQEEPIKAELGVETPKPTLSPEEELASLEKNLFSAQLPEEDNSQKENLLAATRQVADATVNLLKQVPDRPEASSEKNIEQKVEPQSQSQTEPEAAPSPSSTPKRKGGRVAELIAKHEGFIEEAGKDLNSQQVQEKDTKKVLSQSLEEKGMEQPEKVAGMVMDFSKKVAANFVASNEGVSQPEQNFQMMMKAILTAATVKKDSQEHQKVSGRDEKENQKPSAMNGMGDMQGMSGMDDAQALGGEDMASEATMGVGPKDIDKLQNGSKAEKAEVAGKMAATAMGIPPPANAMVGEACGKAVEKMDGMNPKNQIEGVTATMGEIAQGIAAETADGGTAAPASSEEQAGSEFGKLLGNLTASTIKVTTDVVTKGFSGAMSAPGNDGPDPAAEKKGSFTPGANAHQSAATSKKDYVPQPEQPAPPPPQSEPSNKPSAKPASH